MLAHAATFQWEIVQPDASACAQLVTDGSGGCVFVTGMNLVWLDKKGGVKYVTTVGANTIVIACDKKWLVYSVDNGSGGRDIIIVDKKGVATTTTAPSTYYWAPAANASVPVKVQRLNDSKGYFVQKIKLGVYSIQRYSYK
jgi:hypothetical protein